ncbi:PucR C-terminal helix-turn-helix domain-containing protein [Bifidobacterium bohemicum]|uniref:PucR family transcriptional regulator n=1 Tax=Bifidobacterium bohemicum DSM 22767 TaxID=1437606 RepID=A0A086ZES3_9BIFI|nr:helix-turn-helix domain-containing protein [Bifidobacterium bohemicum]KFI45023.1 PucR family transcriptional regulator [Bifidobacterium bohemicum DSM 22767]SCB93569.1 PucR C-terminal helix-turn-helix domain-containing protein [Bifidobacterium bohemicum]
MSRRDDPDFLGLVEGGVHRPGASKTATSTTDVFKADDADHPVNLKTIEDITFESLSDGLTDKRVVSLLHVIGWPDTFNCFAIAGVPKVDADIAARTIRRSVQDLGGRHCLVGRDKSGLTVALITAESAATPEVTCTAVMPAFESGQPVCLGPLRRNVIGAACTIHATLTTFCAMPAVHVRSRPIRADDLLPERALIGDEDAIDELYHNVYQSLGTGSDPTLETVETFLTCGGSLDQTGRELNVHPNTVRYRIKRATEATGWDAGDPRDAYVLRTAIALGRIRDAEGRRQTTV